MSGLLEQCRAAVAEMDTDRPVRVGDFVQIDGVDDFYDQVFEGEYGLVLTVGEDLKKVWVFDEDEAYDFDPAALTIVTREEALA